MAHHTDSRIDRNSPVSAVTSFAPVLAAPHDDLHELARLMTEAGCGSLIVRGRGDDYAIVTERDVLWALAGGSDVGWAVELMSRDVICVPADTTIAEAAATMIEAGVRHLAVSRDDGEIGVTSMRDLIEPLLEER
ncbi:MAG: CBS domain-containing protein [Acidimicrobiales bacterium]